MRAAPALMALAVLAAGCLAPGTVLETPEGGPKVPSAKLVLGDIVHEATEGFRWSGSATKNLKQDFTLDLPGDHWTTHKGTLEASVIWAHNATGSFVVTILDATGQQIARGTNGWYASVALVQNPKPGNYQVRVQPGSATSGADFEAIIQLDAAPKAEPTGKPLLPNLVTIPPVDLQIRSPTFGMGGDAGPTRGCGYDETAEHRAVRCLRVSNGVGNIGEGPLEVRLSLTEAAKSPAGLGVWMQRIYHDDGTIKEVPVGNAVFHATHAHWHYSGLAKFDLFKYDLESKTRGDHVGKSNKNGFCFFDIGLVELGLPNTPRIGYRGGACLTPEQQQQAWFMGLSPNWFDFYHWNLPDQYVEITGLPDGVYELVSTASGAGLLHETDKEDNTASAVIRITGDRVETLASWSDYRV